MHAVLITRGSRGMALFQPKQPTIHVPIFGPDEVDRRDRRRRHGDRDDVARARRRRLVLRSDAARELRRRSGRDETRHRDGLRSRAERRRRERSRHVARELVARRAGAGTAIGIRDCKEIRTAGRGPRTEGLRTERSGEGRQRERARRSGCARPCGRAHDCLRQWLLRSAARRPHAISARRRRGGRPPHRGRQRRSIRGRSEGDRDVRYSPAPDRAELVAALRGVDYVILFGDPTVERLLRLVKPDVHCKGTDYTVDSVPERAVVQSYGGRTAIVGDPEITRDPRSHRAHRDTRDALSDRPSRRTRRHRARDSGGRRASSRVSDGANRLAGQRQAPRDPRSRARHRSASADSRIAAARTTARRCGVRFAPSDRRATTSRSICRG